MSTKFVNFLTMCWFLSTLIALVVEGSYINVTENTVINNLLSSIRTLQVAGLAGIPIAGFKFMQGFIRTLLWDYSYYAGGYTILRYFWLAVFSPAVVWAIVSTAAPTVANLLRFK